ncbi:MAG: glycoside hydrolase N-terminal domain-containing protein [Bryobacterales bacterium]|nr:glycoside hydrolase N-terminal domain-containing protein [Bryobacterales bacterium]
MFHAHSGLAFVRSTVSYFLLLAAVAATVWAQPRPEHGLHFTIPVTTWDEALPMGNGMVGALLWGDGRPVKISLDRADLWDLRLVPEFQTEEYTFSNVLRLHRAGRHKELERMLDNPYRRPAPTKIPAGRIEITLPDGARFASTTLRVEDGEGRIEFQNKASVRAFVHATEAVGLVWIGSKEQPAIKLVAPPFSGRVNDPAAGGIGAGDLAQLGYPAPQVSNGDGFESYTQQGAEGFRFAVHTAWKKASGGWTLAWSIASSFEGGDPAALARSRVEKALSQGYKAALAGAHAAWWKKFWAQSSVRVPNQTIERMWYLETYKFGSASRRGAPPITLQAVWTADNGQLPPWKGDYHHDLNTELSYWPSYSGNHLEEELAYLDWLWKTRDAGFRWTKKYFELPGLNVPMTADLNGNQIGGWRQYTHSATTAAWLAHHFYLHWRYSQDREFLKHRAYPYLKSASEFLEAYFALPDRLFSSPEINDNKPNAWFDQPTNFDLSLARWLFAATAELAAELKLTDEAAQWRGALAKLPALAKGEDGKLLVAPRYPLPGSHRHFSHLMAIHPLGIVDLDDGAEAERTIKASLAELDKLGTDWWTGYSFSWLASIAARARDGAKAEKALELFTTAFCLRNSFHCNGDQTGKGHSKFTYRPFTLEGNFAAAEGLQEMLLQSHRGVMRVFPAVPDGWKEASFHSLRAEGAFLVSAERRGGRTAWIEVMAERGGTARVFNPMTQKVEELALRAGERRRLRF